MADTSSDLKLNDIRSDEYRELQASAYANDVVRLQARMDEFVAVTCPACDADQATLKYKKYKCCFVKCTECSTIYMSPRPSVDVMTDYYQNSENYAIWNKYVFPKSEDSRRDKICQPNLAKIIEACRDAKIINPVLLEIGPGFGTFAALALESGFFREVFVVERNPNMAHACRDRGLTVIEASLEEMNFEEFNGADMAVCFEVIEHVFDPAKFVQHIGKLLRPGGCFAFTCPNGMGFDTAMLGVEAAAVDTEHVNLFNPTSISQLLERCGFSVISIDTPGRLDVELVQRGIAEGELDVSGSDFWHSLLIEGSDEVRRNFQAFLANNQLAGNMRVIAKKTDLVEVS